LKALDIIKKTRQYLDYLEEHILNVQRAWKELNKRLDGKGTLILSDDFDYWRIDALIKAHDISKLSEYELVQYRRKFYPIEGELIHKEGFDGAWSHHKDKNPHHWENWTQIRNKGDEPYLHLVTMIVDWMAMSYKFGGTAQEYYEKNKDTIKIPKKYHAFMYEIFDKLKEPPHEK
jgi:hypothetical protein